MAPRKNGHSREFIQKAQPADFEKRLDEKDAGSTDHYDEDETAHHEDDLDDTELTEKDFEVDGDEEDQESD